MGCGLMPTLSDDSLGVVARLSHRVGGEFRSSRFPFPGH